MGKLTTAQEKPPLGPIVINGKPMTDRQARAVRRLIERGATPCGVLNLLLMRDLLKAARKATTATPAAGNPPMA